MLSNSAANLSLLGLNGVIAARQRDTTEARRISRQLGDMKDKYLLGANTIWRARIAGEMGEREAAVALLRDAFMQGLTFDLTLHADPAFASLRDDAAFQELLRPKG